ncbi:hypothetical protein OIU74_003036 [Salix koriyanagi]|uniref:Uncharacterized protein n=1 Tax=Salix koriyanagi TaxID=2511006 RepID=A0A9Q0UX28_9ROSI|nr:hypothetical protein OIU74_003036 [Salix koriyanagi]
MNSAQSVLIRCYPHKRQIASIRVRGYSAIDQDSKQYSADSSRRVRWTWFRILDSRPFPVARDMSYGGQKFYSGIPNGSPPLPPADGVARLDQRWPEVFPLANKRLLHRFSLLPAKRSWESPVF